MHVKGLEISMHDPRAWQAMALTYACAPAGGRHMDGETIFMENEDRIISYPELGSDRLDRLSTTRKADIAFKIQNLWAALSAAGYCLLACATGTSQAYTIALNVEFLNLVTGLNFSYDEFVKAGERIYNIKRAFGVRHGLTKKDDVLPSRFLSESRRQLTKDGYRKTVALLDKMLPEYYAIRGWDTETGKPTREKLSELNLGYITEELY